MSQFKIGAIVALKSHPYQSSLTKIVFSGEPQLTSPLMVIVEHLDDVRDQFDEKTGNSISEKGQSQCKCIWYSTKSHQFEEAWLSSKLLKIITENLKSEITPEIIKTTIGCQAILKTSDIELGKKKSSLSFKDNSDFGRTTITPLLSFVSPIMQIIQYIETKKSDIKEPLYDTKTGNQKRFYSEWSAKCKWYNPSSEKMVEKFIPLDALSIIKTIDETYLAELQKSIYDFTFLKSDTRLLQPKNLTYRNGIYYLRAYDFVKNKVKDYNLNTVEKFTIVNDYSTTKAPFFNPLTSEILSKIDAINNAKKSNAYIRIIYKKKNGEISTRTIHNYSIEKANNLKGIMTDYLQGYCNLRKAVRVFKIKRVQQIEVLDLNFIP
jgi:thiol-disulfide isomerase/thioredoxin